MYHILSVEVGLKGVIIHEDYGGLLKRDDTWLQYVFENLVG